MSATGHGHAGTTPLCINSLQDTMPRGKEEPHAQRPDAQCLNSASPSRPQTGRLQDGMLWEHHEVSKRCGL